MIPLARWRAISPGFTSGTTSGTSGSRRHATLSSMTTAPAFTAEEHRLRDESRKILGAPALGVCATCVRVPVFNGHAESIVAELERPMNAKAARELLRAAPGILLMDEAKDGGYPTPLDAEGTDATFVGRLRDDPTAPNSVAFWCVADNVRKGAAANAVQIAEILVRDYL